jgi:hypothetical protein
MGRELGSPGLLISREILMKHHSKISISGATKGKINHKNCCFKKHYYFYNINSKNLHI